MNGAQLLINRLTQGNQRFINGERRLGDISAARRLKLSDGQSPEVVVLGCADSRVPVELIFDQGLGELFVVRVAGNIVDSTVLGSVEFAVAEFGCELIVVLGHSNCGAVKATLQETCQPSETLSPNLKFIVDAIEPAVRSVMTDDNKSAKEELTKQAIHANVRQSTERFCQKSHGIQSAVSNGKLTIVGAIYDLKTGRVEFLDNI